MDFVAVLVAAAAGFGVGAAWYMALSKQWLAVSGVKCDSEGKPEGSSPLPFLLSGIAMLLVAGMMRHVFALSGIDGVSEGAVSGFGIGLFFISPWIMINNAYGGRPFRLTLIDGGYAVIGCTVIGLVLPLF